MTKGKFGLSLSFIAVISFGFAAFCQPLAVLLICGFALLAEKDEWLNRQVLQSLLLVVFYYLVKLLFDLIFDGLAWLFGVSHVYGAQSAMLAANSFVDGLIYVALIVLSVIAILRVLRGKDAGLPFLSKLAGGDLSAAFTPKPKQPPVQSAPISSSYQPSQYYAPAPQQVQVEPVQAAVLAQTVQPPTYEPSAAALKRCAACGSPLQPESIFCTACGSKVE
jgi:hypothetical protein